MDDLLKTIASFGASYWATLGVGALCAYLGIFTVLRRIVFTGAALAQASAAGVAASFWALTLPLPMKLQAILGHSGATMGSLGAGMLSALALTRSERRGRLTADSMVGVVFAGSSALAVLFVWRSSQGLVELKNILAGDVLLSSAGDLRALWVGVVGVFLLHAVLRDRFLLVSYDPPFARAQGLDVQNLERLFLISLAVAVAVALRAAGLMLVFGTLVLAPLVGLRVGGTLVRSTWVAVGAAWTSALGGFLLATHQDLPVAPTIVAFQVVLLAVAMLVPRMAEVMSLVGGVAALLVGFSLAAFAPPPMSSPNGQGPAAAIQLDHEDEDHDGAEDPLVEQGEILNDLNRPDSERQAAAAMLAQLGDAEAILPLLQVMADFQAGVVAEARRAVLTLAANPDATGRAHLRSLAEEQDPELATRAARLLVELDDEGAHSLLVERLADPAVPLLLRDDTLEFLAGRNGGDRLGFDAFASPEENAEGLGAWRAWALEQ